MRMLKRLEKPIGQAAPANEIQFKRLAKSKTEALHDLACYVSLKLDIPIDHWAFQEFPEFLTELPAQKSF